MYEFERWPNLSSMVTIAHAPSTQHHPIFQLHVQPETAALRSLSGRPPAPNGSGSAPTEPPYGAAPTVAPGVVISLFAPTGGAHRSFSVSSSGSLRSPWEPPETDTQITYGGWRLRSSRISDCIPAVSSPLGHALRGLRSVRLRLSALRYPTRSGFNSMDSVANTGRSAVSHRLAQWKLCERCRQNIFRITSKRLQNDLAIVHRGGPPFPVYSLSKRAIARTASHTFYNYFCLLSVARSYGRHVPPTGSQPTAQGLRTPRRWQRQP